MNEDALYEELMKRQHAETMGMMPGAVAGDEQHMLANMKVKEAGVPDPKALLARVPQLLRKTRHQDVKNMLQRMNAEVVSGARNLLPFERAGMERLPRAVGLQDALTNSIPKIGATRLNVRPGFADLIESSYGRPDFQTLRRVLALTPVK